MRLHSRVLFGAALAASLGFVPASLGQAQIDMNFNPRPVLNDIELIDLMFPAAFGTAPRLTLFYKVGQPPCSNITAPSCQNLWAQADYGNGSTISYAASFPGTVSFFVKAQSGSLVGYTGIGQIITSAANAPLPETPHPILFVTQVPIPSDYKTVTSTFASHLGRPNASGRGGDLYIRYQDGTLKNLTKLAGFGHSGQQGANSIAVREPSVHWSGTKAVFSMVVGCATSAPSQGNPAPTFYWQLYEVTGLGQLEMPVITRVPNQPANFNNVSPCYGTNGRILFTSDRPRDGSAMLYPQLDEYESQETNTGIWSLDPATGDLFLVQHSPSGSFKPFIDSFGRVVFTRWDHLERDQQKSLDLVGDGNYQTFNYVSETSTNRIGNAELFPEPHPFFVNHVNQGGYSGDLNGWAPNIGGIQFNRFQPWVIRENGTEEETLNHVGRHELQDVVNRAFNDDPALVAHVLATDPLVANDYGIFHMFQTRESGSAPGVYFGVDGRESETHAAGQIIKLTGGLGANPDAMVVSQITHHDTRVPTLTPSANHTGMYRSPMQLSDGQLVSVHTADMGKDSNIGTPSNPISKYEFRLKTLRQAVHADGSTRWRDDLALTPGLKKTVQYRDGYLVVNYSGEMWELDAVEVKARPVPALAPAPVSLPEARAMADAHIRPRDLRDYLRANNLALIVSRNLTTRDRNDKQQPFNLRVAGTSTQTTTGGRLYDIKYLQLFQADQIRGMFWGNPTPLPGRRPLAQPLHDPEALNPPLSGAPAGSVLIASDGSMAALVPARRAMTWQTTDGAGNPVVRERYWVTFQPGEIRVCTSCHGANTGDQLNRPAPTNKPLALTQLLNYLKSIGEIAPSPGTYGQAP